MVYDRRYDDKILRFEPSGGLMKASLVMRDRETDSWWPILVGRAVGGPLAGAPLKELAVSEKITWGDWRRRHPGSLVLAEDGKTHEPLNHYLDYFSSDRAFQNIRVADSRLPAKEPIYSFRIGEQAYAVAHDAIEGGVLLGLPGDPDRQVFLMRRRGASIFESTTAYLVPKSSLEEKEGVFLAAGTALDVGDTRELTALEKLPGVRKLAGFDTYWYTWVAANGGTELLQRPAR